MSSSSAVLPYFDWRLFYATWGLKPADGSDEQLLSLNRDAIACLDRLISEKGCRISAAAIDTYASRRDMGCEEKKLFLGNLQAL